VWYELYITDWAAYTYDQWHDGRTICAEGICAVALDLPADQYEWWVRAWGPGSMSEWNVDAETSFGVVP